PAVTPRATLRARRPSEWLIHRHFPPGAFTASTKFGANSPAGCGARDIIRGVTAGVHGGPPLPDGGYSLLPLASLRSSLAAERRRPARDRGSQHHHCAQLARSPLRT